MKDIKLGIIEELSLLFEREPELSFFRALDRARQLTKSSSFNNDGEILYALRRYNKIRQHEKDRVIYEKYLDNK